MQPSGPGQDDSFDFLFKIILVGDSDVGKTCVVQSFKSGMFSEKQQNTIGVDFTVRTMNIDGKKVKVRNTLILIPYGGRVLLNFVIAFIAPCILKMACIFTGKLGNC